MLLLLYTMSDYHLNSFEWTTFCNEKKKEEEMTKSLYVNATECSNQVLIKLVQPRERRVAVDSDAFCF